MAKTPASFEDLLKKFGGVGMYQELPDPEKWVESGVLICRICSGPASLRPHNEDVLGCVRCNFAVEGILISAFFVPMVLFEESDEIIATD